MCLLVVWLLPLAGQTPSVRVEVATKDTSGAPIIGASVEILNEAGVPHSGVTDALGRIAFSLRPGQYFVTAKKAGFETLEQRNLSLGAEPVALELTLIASMKRTDSVEVHGTVLAVEDNASVPNTLPPKKAKELPNRPATIADALPLTPGVVREPGGGLILSSSPEHRSALIVNSADVTDPATGQFGVTVPIDSVEVLNVYQTAYMAEFGRFTAGLVSVETKRGGDKWNWEINDPLPEFFIRSWHMRGLRTATPRLNFDGPLLGDKLFISEGFEYETRKTPVYTQPFPFNLKREQGLNSFTQLDWVASGRHIVTATVHLAPQRQSSVNLDAFTPQDTAADLRAHNFTGTVFDRLALAGGLLENRFSVTVFDGGVWGRGEDDMVIAPDRNSGSFFSEQNRAASRISGASSYSLRPLEFFGTHQFKLGGYLAGSEQSGDVRRRPIDVVDIHGQRLLRASFPRVRDFEVSDVEKSFFAQNHWILTPRFALDVGGRTESQQISGAFRVAPRTGFSWAPFASAGTVIRGGFGLFYERVPLNVYAFNRYPGRLITTYGPNGEVEGVPQLYLNTLGQSRVRSPFVSQQPIDGNFSPNSTIWSIQVEQPITKVLKLRATFLRNRGTGLVILNRVDPDPQTNTGAYLLEGTGDSTYRQFDIVANLNLRDDRQFFMSYTNSRARGDLNDFGRFLGTLPVPIIQPNFYGTLGTDLPHRFIGWGVMKLPHKFQIAPVVEYRSGFPYVETDAAQNYASQPNSHRFPRFLSIDSRFSKDLKINSKYSIRVSVSGFNLTNHFNPEAVRANTGDPAFGYFFGHRGRRFTADFDFLF